MSGLYLWGICGTGNSNASARPLMSSLAAAVIEGTAHGQLQRAQNAVRARVI